MSSRQLTCDHGFSATDTQGVKNAPIPRRKSAPLGVRFDTEKNNVDKQIGGGETDENVSYQSTLLHMRVVGEA